MKTISRRAPGSMRMMPRLDSRSSSRRKDLRPRGFTVSEPITLLTKKRAVAPFATALLNLTGNKLKASGQRGLYDPRVRCAPINPKDLHAIDPFELVGAPFDLCLGLPALHGLRKGVNNNVLRPCESRLFVGGPGIALVQPVLGLFPERRHLGVLEPGWVSVVLHYGLKHITFLKPPPITELLILEPPLQKLLRAGDVLGVFQDGKSPALQPVEPTRRPFGDEHVVDVFRKFGLVLLGRKVDAGAVEGAGNLLGEERPVVVAVVPGSTGRVIAILPGLDELPHAFYEFRLVELDCIPV